MRMPGTSWFWTAVAILVVAAVCLFPSQAKAYEYRDDFNGDNAENDSYFHSIFWPQGAFPPRQAYLYFQDTGDERELGFGEYNDEPAYLVYRFPEGSENLTGSVYGELLIDVRRLESSGYLSYELSADGVNWSSPEDLETGSQQEIHIESVRGSCYVKFFGTGVLIDNLEVNLYTLSATILVPEDYATIQDAIDNASDGDIIEVGRGTYSDEGNRDIDFLGLTITVLSSDGPDYTIIDCSGSEGHRGFYFRRNEGPDSVLRGFTIKGATMTGSNDIGGGILCEVSSPSIVDCVIEDCAAENGGGIGVNRGSPSIIDCVIENCRAGGFEQAGAGGRGGGIGLFRSSDATILHTRIINNSSYDNSFGAGVYCWRSSALFSNCDISHNTAQGNVKGGGVGCNGSSDILFKNCVISNNTAEIGGGISVGYSGDSAVESVTITNCTIAHNSLSTDQPDTPAGGGIHTVSSDIIIRNSIVCYNDNTAVMLIDPVSDNPVQYSCIEGGYDGQDNIDSDPLFASSSGNDYHLRSFIGRYQPGSGRWVEDDIDIGEYSPCIDAGDPQDPVGAEPVPNGRRINMGAYGGTVEASKSKYGFIFHVDKSGSNSSSGLSRSDAFRTIQKAVDMACDGDTILVWPGTYREDVDLKGKAITLQSADEAAKVTASSDFAFSFFTGETSNCVLRNFIITGCNSTDGAAIYLDAASPTLTNLTITDNIFGIKAEGGADPDIVNCILWSNQNGDLHHCRARYSCVQQEGAVNASNGNISTDPKFADSDSGDYHLKSRHGRYSPIDGTWPTDSISSPCIDTGNPGRDPGREQRPHGSKINMGAYGGTPFASLSGQ
ncbi:MAG: right-handed parallel beta-helix repeat-containing protein [Planctomycetota bacterium]